MFRSFPKHIGRILLGLCVMTLIASTALASSQAVTLVIDGSTTVFPVVQVSETRFPVTFPDTSLSVTSTGSGHGQISILNGLVDIGMSSSACKVSNQCVPDATGGACATPFQASPYTCAQLVDTQFARDAVSIVVNVNRACAFQAGAAALSKLQIQAIWEGGVISGTTVVTTTPPTSYTWGQLFPNCVGQSFANNTVVPRARIIGSGTRQSFLDLTGTLDAAEQAKIASTGLPRGAGNPDIEGFIDHNPDQIGYVGLAFLDPNIHAVALDFTSGATPNPAIAVFPSDTTVSNGTYPMSRVLHLYTLPTAINPKQRIQDYLAWIAQPEAQAIVKNIGYVPVGPQAPDWDVNLDHVASILDIAQIGIFFGQTAPASGNPADPLIRGWVRADANWDGTVNILDVATVGNAWGQTW